ncbi:hypothetical protein [Clostridium botulinum]|uniref:hypothetical protein n=1 Tax=Clostridium botulinum TaxID=1491 RepID=UPI001C9A83A4|nr:hypothetical protein [Clostridium botulinum]MBY6842775.1 hypothetical protein [Clostridium botulinum]
MYSDYIMNCGETIFSQGQGEKLYNMINKANYSDSFKEILNNISKKEIIELLQEYDQIHTYNFEDFYKDNNKHKRKGSLYE